MQSEPKTSLVACFTFAQENTKIEIFSDCVKTEGFTHLTGLVLDLYYGKINFSNFVSKYLEWSMRSNTTVLSKCLPIMDLNKSQLIFKSALNKVGLTLLYASNCEKDLGPAFMVLDSVIANLENVKAEWKQALMNTFTLGLIGYQSFQDCKSAFENIKDIWTSSQ